MSHRPSGPTVELVAHLDRTLDGIGDAEPAPRMVRHRRPHQPAHQRCDAHLTVISAVLLPSVVIAGAGANFQAALR
jgi:hypothetical protein